MNIFMIIMLYEGLNKLCVLMVTNYLQSFIKIELSKTK